MVIAAGQDALAEALDAEKGGSVTDHTIFDAHSRRFEAEFHKDMEDLGVRPADVIKRWRAFTGGGGPANSQAPTIFHHSVRLPSVHATSNLALIMNGPSAGTPWNHNPPANP